MNTFFHLSLNHNPPGCQNADVPHVHKHHELLYVTSGEGAQLFNGREIPLETGNIFFFPAGTCHCSIFLPGKCFDCFVLRFEDRFFTPSIASDQEVLNVVAKMSQFHGKVPISAAGGEAIGRAFHKFLPEFQQKGIAYHAVLKMMTTQVLVSIARDPEFAVKGRPLCKPLSQESMIQEVINYLDAFYMNDITIDTILEFCLMSRSHFHAVFKATTGKTLIEYLTDIRLAKAKQFLFQTDMPVAEIASQTGFRSSGYFCQVFRSAIGLPPGKYRERRPGC